MALSKTRAALGLASVALGTLVTYWALLATRQDRIMFNTRRTVAGELPEGFSTYSHVIPGGLVRGFIYHPEGELAVSDMLVYIPGRGEDVRKTAAMAASLPPGLGFAALNYRGVADSHGLPSEASAVADFCQLTRHLRQAFPHAKLHLVGRSLGTGVAVQLAAATVFESIQLITPYDSLVEVARKRFPMAPVKLLMKHQFDSVKHSRTIASRAQVLLAETDDVVEHVRSQKLIDAWPQPLRVERIEGVNHHSIMASPATWLSLSTFAKAGAGFESHAA
jgi:alpha/beta superfamily hydrolase